LITRLGCRERAPSGFPEQAGPTPIVTPTDLVEPAGANIDELDEQHGPTVPDVALNEDLRPAPRGGECAASR
jgi:hypothetical protein